MIGTFDVDGVSPEWSSSRRDTLKGVSCIAGSNQTTGGGLCIFVYTGFVSPEEWKEKFMEVCDFLEALLNCKVDRKCNDITRCSFFSYGPNAWCRTAYECETFVYMQICSKRLRDSILQIKKKGLMMIASPLILFPHIG